MAYLEMRGITKRFGSVVANDHVDLSVERGEIHALLGENGAGKSTLMNVLYGMYDYFDGEVLLDGQPLHIKSPRDAIAHGIGMVHQHFMLIPAHTVVENIILGLPGGAILGIRQAAEEIRALAESLHIDIDPLRPCQRADGGAAAAGGDPEGTLPQGEAADFGRAYRRPHAPGVGEPV